MAAETKSERIKRAEELRQEAETLEREEAEAIESAAQQAAEAASSTVEAEQESLQEGGAEAREAERTVEETIETETGRAASKNLDSGKLTDKERDAIARRTAEILREEGYVVQRGEASGPEGEPPEGEHAVTPETTERARAASEAAATDDTGATESPEGEQPPPATEPETEPPDKPPTREHGWFRERKVGRFRI